jgi:hypothetical protein
MAVDDSHVPSTLLSISKFGQDWSGVEHITEMFRKALAAPTVETALNPDPARHIEG